MTEPRRLLDSADDEVESMLLQSAKRDAPSERAVNEALLALGLGGGVAVGVTTAAATGGATAGASIPPAAAAAGKLGIAVVVKWVGIAAIGGLATWGIVQQASSPEPQAAKQAMAQLAEPTGPGLADDAVANVPPATDDSEPQEQDEQPAASEEPAVAEPAAPTPPPVAPVAKGQAKPAKPDLADEVAALDRARKAMADDPDAALEAIEDYQSKYGDGMLAQEAKVMRIESLQRAGKHEQARAAAQQFLAQHPSSPLAPRARSVLSSTDK